MFEDVQSSAKAVTGSPAERIDVGEGGWAFEGKSISRAAAVSRGKIYLARMSDPLGSAAAGRKDALVRLVARMMQ